MAPWPLQWYIWYRSFYLRGDESSSLDWVPAPRTWELTDPKDSYCLKRGGLYLPCTWARLLWRGYALKILLFSSENTNSSVTQLSDVQYTGMTYELCPQFQLCLKASSEHRHNLTEPIVQAGCYFVSLFGRYFAEEYCFLLPHSEANMSL